MSTATLDRATPPWNHNTGGSCNDELCPLHGFCHCGCGGTANVSPYNHSRANRTRGKPYVYLSGHCRGRGAVPSAVLVEPIKEFCDRQGLSHRGCAQLFSDRFSMTFPAAERAMHRILSGQTRHISLPVADQWAVFLDLDPVTLWGVAW